MALVSRSLLEAWDLHITLIFFLYWFCNHAAPDNEQIDSTKVCSDFTSTLSLHPKLASLVGEIMASLAADGMFVCMCLSCILLKGGGT